MDSMATTNRRSAPSRAAWREADAVLARPHALPSMLGALLLCLLVAFAVIGGTEFLMYFSLLFVETYVINAIIDIGLFVLAVLAVVACLMPLWLGKLRMAGLWSAGDEPLAREVLYYFTSRSRYLRALRAGALTLLLLSLPALAVFLLFAGAWNLYVAVFDVHFGTLIAVLLLLAALLAALALSVGVLFFGGIFFSFAALAVGNETLPVRRAFLLSVSCGKKNARVIFRFSLRALWQLLLSFLTVGVLWALWFSHRYNLAYLKLSMITSSEEE
ncbi:MAG: hypothetical protein IJW51_01285 [Clostridia bacterium]|nr:hypothetical protein [Clostridia bacterium]